MRLMGAVMSVEPEYEWPRPPEGGYTADDLDRLLELADAGLRGSFGRAGSSRPTPGNATSAPVDPGRRRHAAGLMRVNHAGEIAAQGLYHGQALTARSPEPAALDSFSVPCSPSSATTRALSRYQRGRTTPASHQSPKPLGVAVA